MLRKAESLLGLSESVFFNLPTPLALVADEYELARLAEAPTLDSFAALEDEEEASKHKNDTVRLAANPKVMGSPRGRRRSVSETSRRPSWELVELHQPLDIISEEPVRTVRKSSITKSATGTLSIQPRKPRRRTVNSTFRNQESSLKLLALLNKQALPESIRIQSSINKQGAVNIMEGNVDSLIDALTVDVTVEGDYTLQFLCSYRFFKTADHVLSKMIENFSTSAVKSSPPDPMLDEFNATICVKLLNVLQRWARHFSFDFFSDAALENKLNEFLQSPAVTNNEEYSSHAEIVQAYLANNRDRVFPAHFLSVYEPESDQPNPPSPRGDSFTELSYLTFAQQLCLIEHEILCSIDAHDLLQQTWLPSSQEREISPIVTGINWFNRFAFWVATEVINAPNMKTRVQVIERFINIARLCKNWNNLSTFFQIIVGLNLGPVSRLTKTWSRVSSKHIDHFRLFNTIVNGDFNYKMYRETLAKCAAPGVPYLGIFLKDMTAVLETSEFVNKEDLVQFHKLAPIWSAVDTVLQLQKDHYKFPISNSVKRFLETRIVPCTLEELYDRGRQLEASEA